MINHPDKPENLERGWVLRNFRRYPYIFAFVLGILFLTAIRPLLRHIPDPPPVLLALPSYELVDHDGQAFTDEGMAGKVWVAGFIFTTCPTTCPRVSQAMVELQQRFADNDIDVELVSFTVDPERDTPEVLATYADNIGADQTRWRFVTGDAEAIRELVVGGFKQAAEPMPADQVGAFDIVHSTRLAIVDDKGGVRGFYGTDESGLDEVFHRTQHVLREVGEP